MKKVLAFIKTNQDLFVLTFLVSLSYFCCLYFFQGGKNLIYADAISRLDIARKVIDNITPGLPQVGNVWLPLPQLFMVPLIWHEYMWHSGLAGYIMSGISFVLSGLFIYGSAKIITKSSLAGIFSVLLFALNINILYLQTTAMSESIFVCFLAASIYYFLRWIHDKKDTSLVLAALAVCGLTLIRYEALAILLASIPMVAIYSFIHDKSKSMAEGHTILYSTLACLGFALWTIYLWVIFGRPLYWKEYYATPQATGGADVAFTQAKPFLEAVWQYFTSFVWMIGLIPTAFAIIGTMIMIIYCIRQKSWNFIALLMPLSIFLFMVMTLMRNTPIVQPDLTIATLMAGDTSNGTGFNIRYGLLLLPWAAIMASYLLIWKNKIIRLVLFVALMGIFSLQLYTYVNPAFTLIYKIPARIYEKPFSKSVDWIKKNYDGGKILISAGSQEDQMFAMGFPYKTYIHEGTNKYWKESLNNPSRYAKWVVIDYGHSSDNLAKFMNREDILEREYKVVYTENQLKIYKKITKPYYEIK